jgi:hypothetical protein
MTCIHADAFLSKVTLSSRSRAGEPSSLTNFGLSVGSCAVWQCAWLCE